MAKEKSLFKFYLKATCLLKLCIEGRTNMFYICFDTVFVTHYEYIYIKSTVILAETCDAILFYSVILRRMYLRKFVNNVPISTDYK